jgi:hypothetical protein
MYNPAEEPYIIRPLCVHGVQKQGTEAARYRFGISRIGQLQILAQELFSISSICMGQGNSYLSFQALVGRGVGIWSRALSINADQTMRKPNIEGRWAPVCVDVRILACKGRT